MSSGFVSESALEEKRRIRQAEWEKVRKPEDPKDAPEEVYDPRCLYDRLKEQKDKKDAEWDEAHKLKNMVRGLDDDEAGFLDFVDKTKLAEELKILKEEENELQEYRKAVAKENEERLLTETRSVISSVPSKKSMQPNLLLSGSSKLTQKCKMNFIVKKRSITDDGDVEKHSKKQKSIDVNSSSTTSESLPNTTSNSSLQCAAILPGIGCYEDSSDSDSSRDSSSETDVKTDLQYDLFGRTIPNENSE